MKMQKEMVHSIQTVSIKYRGFLLEGLVLAVKEVRMPCFSGKAK